MPTTAPATFVWDDSCVVGRRVIDAQHMRLVAMINNLHDATLFGGGQKKISRTLDDLLGYTQAHFAVEERLM
jgi:hemerythrin